jgi:hypothetical protein
VRRGAPDRGDEDPISAKAPAFTRHVEEMTVALERLYALLSELPAGGGKRRAKPSPAR